jgi:hypothetical protein
MIEIIKNIAIVLGCVSTALTLIITISKSAREWFKKLLTKRMDEKCKENKIDNLENKVDGIVIKLDKYIASDNEFKEALLNDINVQKDFAKDQCRNTIKDIFYRYCDSKRIPLYELKIAKATFETYSNPKKLNSNSYISLLFNEMLKWDIDYTHCFEADDDH